MTPSDPKALLAIWANVAPGHREEYQRWHNCEHTTDRVLCPGFRVCRRLQAVDGEKDPDFLVVYEAQDQEAFRSAPYLHQLNHPSPWSLRLLPCIKDVQRAVYRLEASFGNAPPVEASYIRAVRLNPPDEAGAEEEVARWYREEHLPRLGAVEGVIRGRLFRNAEEITNIRTEEMKIQGTAPGGRTFLAYYELASLDPLASDAWQEAAWGTVRSQKMRPRLRDMIREDYWLHFTRAAPGGRG